MLEEVVEEALARHGGGTSYFDYLDEQLRRPEFFRALLDKVFVTYGRLPDLVVSGQFGFEFRAWYWGFGFPLYPGPTPATLQFVGDLRHGATPRHLPVGQLRSSYVFLDDSFYFGRTLSAVSDSLSRSGSTVESSFVIYDGSPSPSNAPDHALYIYRNRTVKGQ